MDCLVASLPAMTMWRVQRSCRRDILQSRRMRRAILDAVFQMHALVGRRRFATQTPDAILSRGGSGAAQSRRRNSGTHCEACFPRNRRRTCIHRCICAHPPRSAARSLSQYSQFGRSSSAMIVSSRWFERDHRKSAVESEWRIPLDSGHNSPSFRGARSASPESIHPRNLPPNGFRARPSDAPE